MALRIARQNINPFDRFAAEYPDGQGRSIASDSSTRHDSPILHSLIVDHRQQRDIELTRN